MNKTLTLFLIWVILATTACSSPATPLPTDQLAAEPPAPAATKTSQPVPPTMVEPSTISKLYNHSIFGLGFQYPADWFGPDEYISDQTLRVAVGSDVVYPYGTDRSEQIYNVKNSYYVVVQYSINDQNQYWRDTDQSLKTMQDGETRNYGRSQIIRVRHINLGRFEGIEYISTLSDTAQTEPVYSRQVILFDARSNLLTITGTPNNVDFSNGTGWRAAFQSIDQANLIFFHQIVESLTVE